MSEINIQSLFLDLQKQLQLSLRVASKCTTHPVAMGDGSELRWFEMLDTYMPKRYSVAKQAFVIDSNGERSEQIDLLIHDRHYSPLIFTNNATVYIPAESVYATFEVKPKIDKDYIEYASKKFESVRRLERTSISITHAGGRFEPVKLPHILGGFLSFSSGWSPPFGKPFYDHIENAAESPHTLIDVGCVLNEGAFELSGAGYPNPKIEVSEKDDALVFFFVRLLARLQAMGTVPAMDIMAYAKWLAKRPQPTKWE